MFQRWKRNHLRKQQGAALYNAALQQSRSPALYADFAVPDTLDGRFDALVLHVFLIMHALDAHEAEVATDLQRALQERMVDDFDRSLREAGVGDLSVGKKVKAMTQAFRGRFEAYASGMRGERDLAEALARNIYRADAPGDFTPARDLAAYTVQADKTLRALPLSSFENGDIAFPKAEKETV